MNWIEERDALIAQSKAFVEQVTRRSASSAASGARPLARDPVVPGGAPSVTAAPPAKVNDKINETTRKATGEPAATPASAPLARQFDQISMSSEIRARIAAFRAHQERFNRERHEYFNATLARLRAELDELPPSTREEAGSGGSVRRPDATQPKLPAAGVPSAGRRPEERT